MEDALEAGAADFSSESDDVYEIYTEPEDFGTVTWKNSKRKAMNSYQPMFP